MSTLWKDWFNENFYSSIGKSFEKILPSFDNQEFKNQVLTKEFEGYELRDRMMHTVKVLRKFMNADYSAACNQLISMMHQLSSDGHDTDKFEYMLMPDFILLFGVKSPEASIKTMEKLTQFTSCEFAVRPFLLKHPEIMYPQMLEWSKHSAWQVRRLSSEGFRPNLPWGMGIPSLKTDPSPILPVLENLMEDENEVVRRSAANNLNDISKNHPKLVIEMAQKWKGKSKETDALIKHASRTLLKQGEPQILKIFGYDGEGLKLLNFKLADEVVQMGKSLEFSFAINNQAPMEKLIRLEYALYYKKQNGSYTKKVFKISERNLEPNNTLEIIRKQSFKPITTRKYYNGEHKVAMIINGEESDALSFKLVDA